MTQTPKAKKTRNISKFIIVSNLGFIFCIFGLLFVNIIQSNEAAKEGFILKSLNKKKSELQNTNKDLNIMSAQLQSINRIKQVSEESLGMVNTDKIDYVVIKDDVQPVAVK